MTAWFTKQSKTILALSIPAVARSGWAPLQTPSLHQIAQLCFIRQIHIHLTSSPPTLVAIHFVVINMWLLEMDRHVCQAQDMLKTRIKQSQRMPSKASGPIAIQQRAPGTSIVFPGHTTACSYASYSISVPLNTPTPTLLVTSPSSRT